MSETPRGWGVAARSQGCSCPCFHVVLLSLQAEQSVAELTRTQKSLSVEIADLRAAAANVSSISEALAVEKVQLNNLVLQVSRVAKALASCLSPAAAASQPSCLPAVGLCWLLFLVLSKPKLLPRKCSCL